MRTLVETYKQSGNLHHAYIIEGYGGTQEDIRTHFLALLRFLEEDVGFSTKGNPDFWHATFDTFGIDEGRMLKDMQEKKAFAEGGKKVFIISLNVITHEAQNALLKVFEEPTTGTHFFLLAPSAEMFLPTVLSRVVVIPAQHEKKPAASQAKMFLSASPRKRLELIADIIEEKDKTRAINFLNELEQGLYEVWGTGAGENDGHMSAMHTRAFKKILEAKQYLYDRAPSVKMLLEHISLVTPVVVG